MKKIVSIFLATSIFSTCTLTLTNVKNTFAKELLEKKTSVKTYEDKQVNETKTLFSPFFVAEQSNKKTIEFDFNGGQANFGASVELDVADETVAEALKKKITGDDKNIIPNKTENDIKFVFDGWYKDAELTEGFDMNKIKINSVDVPQKLYAKWTKVSTLLSQLKTLIHDMKRMDKADYTTETVNPLFEKGEDIKTLVNQIKTDEDNWNDTKDVQTHGDKLIEVVYPVQKLYNALKAEKDYLPSLTTAIDEAEKLKSSIKESEFTEKSYKNFSDAIEKAKAIKEANNKDKVLIIKDAIKLLKDTTKELSKNVIGNVTTESGNPITVQAYPEFSKEYKELKTVVDKELKDNSSVLVSQLADKYDVSKLEVFSLIDLNITTQRVGGENITISLASLTDGKNYFLAHINQTTKKIDEIYEGKDNKDGTFTFPNVKRFSPFAVLTAQQKNIPDNNNASQNNTTNTTPPANPNANPQTGDTQSVMLFVVLSLLGAGGIYTVYMIRKKDEENEIELS